jgi:hypothetical protein
MSGRRSQDGITIDESMWPLVIVTFAGSISDEHWREMFRSYDRFYARREKFHVVNDGISVRTAAVSASQRRFIAEAARAHADSSKRWCLGGATVLANAVARGIVTAITWVTPPAYKLTLHATLAEAVDEAIVTLERRAIAIPAAARAYRKSLGSSAA